MSFLYLAYGSNMLTERLRHRCPSARPIGTALVPGHALGFTKPSVDRSGKATLIAERAQGIHTPGVLFEIEEADLPNLDKAEGAGKGYDRLDAFEVVHAGTTDPVMVTTYLAIETRAHLTPYDWYLALVIAGAHEHELDAEHIRALKEIGYQIDGDAARLSRREALRALTAHGHDDVHALLRPSG